MEEIYGVAFENEQSNLSRPQLGGWGAEFSLGAFAIPVRFSVGQTRLSKT